MEIETGYTRVPNGLRCVDGTGQAERFVKIYGFILRYMAGDPQIRLVPSIPSWRTESLGKRGGGGGGVGRQSNQ